MSDDLATISTGILDEVRQFLTDLRHDLPEVFRLRRPPKSPSRTRRVPYRGGHLHLRIVKGSANGRSSIGEDGQTLVLRRSPDDPRPPGTILEGWYRERARQVLSDRVEHWVGQIGVRVRRIVVKDQKTLWGSCSHSGNLNFNWRLLMAPEGVLEYVVIHELCHLLEMNHSKRFWKLVSQWCPDHRVHRRWLREHGPGLKKQVRGGRRFR